MEALKEEARREWELRKHEPAPDLALLVDADLKAGRSELKVGKESLRLTEASLLEATGGVLLSDEARQLLVMGVSVSTTRLHGNVPEYLFFFPVILSSRERSLW